MKRFLFVLIVGFSSPLFAHANHDDTPGNVVAPHGGKMLGVADIYLEVVKSDGSVKVYPVTHDLKAIALRDVKVSANVELPKQKKASAELKNDGEFWTVKVDAKGGRRYTLFFDVAWHGKKGSTKYTIEQ